MPQLTYYSLRPTLDCAAPSPVFLQSEKGELYISAHLRLSGLAKHAHIETRDLAVKFAEFCKPVFQKRYGEAAGAIVVECSAYDDKYLRKNIEQDSLVVRNRIQNNESAPNKSPM
jgi:hypothetical protein